MEWNFPKPEEDPLYQKHYDQKYGKGAFERDFASRKNEEQVQTENRTNIPSNFFEVKSPFKHHWNSEHNVGILERNGKFIGVCVLAAKEIADRESYVRKFGLDFRKDISWNAASSLIEHLSRSPLFKAVLVTTRKVPFQLVPDIPENMIGRKNWTERNYEYHKEAFDSVNRDVKAAKEFGMFPVSDDLRNRQKEEALNAARFLDKSRMLDSQMSEHLKQYRAIKENVFAAALFFYIYTSIHDTFEKAVEEIKSRRDAAKKEAANTYFVKCSDVIDPLIVFSPSFPPYWDEVSKYYNLALAKDVGNFESDKGVALVLKKMFTTALELPPEGVEVEEKIVVPENLPLNENSKPAFIGYLVNSVVKRQATTQRVYFPLDVLVKHGIITGSSGKGKTYFAMHLALQASMQGVECVIIDPHGHFQLLPHRSNIRIEYVTNVDQVVGILKSVYREALAQPIQPGEPKLKKLIIIDEISAGKFGSGIRHVLQMLDSCFSELRKFGYGFVIICTYATEDRGVTPTMRENAETYFIFRKKTITELERIKTLKHPNMNLISYLEEGYFLVCSEDFCPEPFFVKAPRIDSLLVKKEVSAVSAAGDDDDDGGSSNGSDGSGGGNRGDGSDGNGDDEAGDSAGAGNGDDGDVGEDNGDNNDDVSRPSQHSSNKVLCKNCGYEWQPKNKPEEIRQCPRCNSRKWND